MCVQNILFICKYDPCHACVYDMLADEPDGYLQMGCSAWKLAGFTVRMAAHVCQ